MITYKEFNSFYSPRLGLIRSLLALGTLFTLVFNSSADLFPVDHWNDVQAGKEKFIDVVNLFYLFSYPAIDIARAIAAGICLFVISGYLPQISSVLYSWVSYSLFYGSLIIEGGDQITAILSLLLIPVCMIDQRLNHWHNKPYFSYTVNPYLHYFIYSFVCIMQLQMAFLYLDAGVEKCKVAEWQDGTAIYYWFNDVTFGAQGLLLPLMNTLFQSPHLCFLFTWGVILLELLLFTSLFMKPAYKSILFYTAVFFHFFIFIIHGLPSFGLAMCAGLFILLKPVSEKSLELTTHNLKNYFSRFFLFITKRISSLTKL